MPRMFLENAGLESRLLGRPGWRFRKPHRPPAPANPRLRPSPVPGPWGGVAHARLHLLPPAGGAAESWLGPVPLSLFPRMGFSGDSVPLPLPAFCPGAPPGSLPAWGPTLSICPLGVGCTKNPGPQGLPFILESLDLTVTVTVAVTVTALDLPASLPSVPLSPSRVRATRQFPALHT